MQNVIFTPSSRTTKRVYHIQKPTCRIPSTLSLVIWVWLSGCTVGHGSIAEINRLLINLMQIWGLNLKTIIIIVFACKCLRINYKPCKKFIRNLEPVEGKLSSRARGYPLISEYKASSPCSIKQVVRGYRSILQETYILNDVSEITNELNGRFPSTPCCV